MKYNIIFLDVDGVLNCEHPSDGDFTFHELHKGEGLLNSNCILRLKHILETVDNSKIVLSSTWRTYSWRIEKLKFYFNKFGIKDPNIIIDITPRIGTRTKDISTWLDNNRDIVNRYVAIDDYLLELDSSVRTEPRIGLSNKDAANAIRLLSE